MHKRLAIGGMAELFLARDTEKNRWVAIKRILPFLATQPEFVQMFLDEARIAAQVHHPNVIEVYELGSLEGSIFLAMEYVEGFDLRRVLQEEAKTPGQGRVPPMVAAFVGAEIAGGLYFAHNQVGLDGRPLQVIHRDVSPQNVMLGVDGRVKLVDFGIAKAGVMIERSEPGVIKGKFLYLAPEQVAQEKVDHRADLFALGTLLYEVTTGKAPFARATTEAVIYAIRAEEPSAPEALVPGYPPGLSRVVMRCLEKDRTKRYQSGLEIQRDLRAFLTEFSGRTDFATLVSYLAQLFAIEDPTAVRRRAADDSEHTDRAPRPLAPRDLEATDPHGRPPLGALGGRPDAARRNFGGDLEEPKTIPAVRQELEKTAVGADVELARESEPTIKGAGALLRAVRREPVTVSEGGGRTASSETDRAKRTLAEERAAGSALLAPRTVFFLVAGLAIAAAGTWTAGVLLSNPGGAVGAAAVDGGSDAGRLSAEERPAILSAPELAADAATASAGPEDAGGFAEAEETGDAGQPEAKPAVSSRVPKVPVELRAPRGTRVSLKDRRGFLPVNRRFALIEGTHELQYQCPGKKKPIVNFSLEVSPQTNGGPVVKTLSCR